MVALITEFESNDDVDLQSISILLKLYGWFTK